MPSRRRRRSWSERRPDRCQAQGEGNPGQPNPGQIVSVRGSVVAARFDEHLPPVYSLLVTGPDKTVFVEVLAQQDDCHVRGIALTPTEGLARGMMIEDTGSPLKARVVRSVLSLSPPRQPR
jgi:F-type H+-transporting ATPase subunit beta